jgi:hypothetical protein
MYPLMPVVVGLAIVTSMRSAHAQSGAAAAPERAQCVASYSDTAYRPTSRPLVDTPEDVRILWQGPHHMGVGKGSSSSTVGKGLELEKPEESFYGGCSSPIAAHGLIFVHYARPSGEAIDLEKVDPRRLARREKEPPLFHKIRADDITVALDAVTGKVVWTAREEQTTANLGGGKRDHWTTSPVYLDGKVIVVNQLGGMFAYDSRTGKKLWQRAAADHAVQRVNEAVAAGRNVSDIGLSQSSLTAADGVIIEPIGRGLRGVDPTNGKTLWSRSPEKGGAWTLMHQKTTPAVWRHSGREYALINSGPALHLLDPKTGEQIWEQKTGGAQRTPVIVGDYVVWPVRTSKHANEDQKPGVWGAFKLSLTGAEIAWELPDERGYLALYTDAGDRAAERNIIPGDGEVVLGLWGGKAGPLDRDPAGLLIKVDTGKIIASIPTESYMRIGDGLNKWTGVQGYFIGPDLFVDHLDVAHADRFMVMRLNRIDRAAGKIIPLGAIPARREMSYLGAYEVPIEIPVVNGRAYYRTLLGIACFEFGKSKEGE